MKGIKNIRFIFIVAVLVVVVMAACGTSSPPVQPSPVTNAVSAEAQATPEPTAVHPTPTPSPTPPPPTPIPTPEPSNLPPAVQVLSVDYQEAFRLLPDGEWAQKLFAQTFDDFDAQRFAQADDTEPVITVVPIQPLGAGDEFNLKRVLGSDEAKPWVEAKVAKLSPAYGDKFAEAEKAEERLGVLKEAVMAGDVRSEVLVAEIYFRWQALLSGMTEEQADLDIAGTLQMMGRSDLWYTVSEKGMIIRLNELRVCQLLMSEIVGVRHTLDVEENNKCNLEKVVELANGAILSGKEQPTEEDYRQLVEEHEQLRAVQ